MDIEKVALEAIKQKIEEIFKKVQVKSSIEGREIVVRISIPNEIMQFNSQEIVRQSNNEARDVLTRVSNLDEEAQKAADELLGL